jgi:dTDP-glucose 4,6-dehydratase
MPPGPFAASRVVVTGGAGFVGSWVCEALLAGGAQVVAVDSFLTGSADNLAHLAVDDRLQLVRADVSEALPVDGRVDAVLHLASPASPLHYLAHPTETLRVGSDGTRLALELAERHRARFVLASTSEVYGDPEQHPQPEDYWGNVNPIGPRSVYDEAKRFAEALTYSARREGRVDAGAVRIFNTYGPRMQLDDGRVVPAFLGQALRGEPLTVAGDGTQTRSLCFVEDTVRGILAFTASAEPGPVNLGNDHEITVLELAETVLRLTGSSSEIVFVDRPEDDPMVRCPDLTRARTLLGWGPTVPLEDGLRRTIAWVSARLGHRAPPPALSAPPRR